MQYHNYLHTLSLRTKLMSNFTNAIEMVKEFLSLATEKLPLRVKSFGNLILFRLPEIFQMDLFSIMR